MAIESQCLTFQVTSWREYCNYRLRGPFTCLLVMVLRLYVIFTFIWRWGGVLHTACGTSQTSDWIHDPYIQFSSVTESCPTLCNPMNCSTPGLPIHHQLLEFTQPCAHWVSNAEGSSLIPRLGRSPGEGNGNSLLGEPMDRSLAGYSPWRSKESDMTGQACMQLYEGANVVIFTESESRMVVSRGWREG